MTNEEFNTIFRDRTKKYAVRILKLIDYLPYSASTKIISYQLGKSASSVGANFRAFCRGRSKNEKFSKICIVVEEADECEYWLETLQALSIGNKVELKELLSETLEIIKICQTLKTAFTP
jgi:four helix bundle protein